MTAVGGLRWVHVFIDVPPASADRARAFWSQALGWPAGGPWAARPEFSSLLPRDGDPYVHVQEVHDDPRVHPDVVVDDLDEARDRLLELGAGAGARTDAWQVMRSPGGLPFCLCREPAAGARPGGSTRDGGHRSRLAQLGVDVPADLLDPELAFWRRATGWRVGRTGHAEFTELAGPDEATVRLMLQRLGPDDPGTTVRAHIDLGSDDIDAESERLGRLGARYVDRFPDWALLVDPAGLPFCVTGASPQ